MDRHIIEIHLMRDGCGVYAGIICQYEDCKHVSISEQRARDHERDHNKIVCYLCKEKGKSFAKRNYFDHLNHVHFNFKYVKIFITLIISLDHTNASTVKNPFLGLISSAIIWSSIKHRKHWYLLEVMLN